MRALWAALVAAFLIITTAPVAGASEIHTIDIDAEIQADGSAIITDTRTFEATEGSEHYISIGNLRDSDVHSFSVVLDGQPLTDIGDWDVDASRQEKAGKSGVVDTGDGYELSFGFGEYGKHTAVMTYTVTNFVYTLADGAQTVYWQFLPRNMTDTRSANISLRNAVGVTYTEDNARIWGFGYEGESAITTNSLRLSTSKPIKTSNHMTMLAIFPEPLFTSNVSRPEDTESLIKRAKEGSDWEDSNPLNWDSNDLFSKAFTVIGGLVIFGTLGYVGWAFLVAFWNMLRPKRSKSAVSAHSGPRTPRAESEYWREVPYDGPIIDIYTLRGYALPDLATALLLKWIHEGALRELQHEAGWVFKREEAAFAIVHMPQLHSEVEATYWDFIVRAARDDGILQRKEIEKFTKKNTSEVSKWQTAAFNYSRQRQIELGLRTVVEKEKRVFFINYTKKEFPLTQAGKDMRNKIDGFKNYLRDFSLLNERTASNVLLWDAYMIWAGYLGIAEEVAKQFNIVDPAYGQQTSISSTAVATGTYFSNKMDDVYTAATTSSYSSSSSSSSGRGGSSSVGGGGGSSGGGSGGGIR